MREVYAVTCYESEDVHEFDENCGLYLDMSQALDAQEAIDDDPETYPCGPHVVFQMSSGPAVRR